MHEDIIRGLAKNGRFLDAYRNDTTVNQMVKRGASTEDILLQLVQDKTFLLDYIRELATQVTPRLVLPEDMPPLAVGKQPPEKPEKKRFTVFCQEAGVFGDTVHIASHEAETLEEAVEIGKRACVDDWSSGFEEGESPWRSDTVHCLGVAAGDIEILHWEDQDT